MTVRRLDSDGDIVTSGTQFLSDAEEIRQTIQTRLGLFLGEYFRDITAGTPWYQKILGKSVLPGSRDAEIRRVISQTAGVESIAAFSSDFDLGTRRYTVACTVTTAFGDVPLEVSNG